MYGAGDLLRSRRGAPILFAQTNIRTFAYAHLLAVGWSVVAAKGYNLDRLFPPPERKHITIPESGFKLGISNNPSDYTFKLLLPLRIKWPPTGFGEDSRNDFILHHSLPPMSLRNGVMRSQLFTAIHRHPSITHGYGITGCDWADEHSIHRTVHDCKTGFDCNVVYAGVSTFSQLMRPLTIKVVKESLLEQSLFQCVACAVYCGYCAWEEILAQNVGVYMRLLKLDDVHPLRANFTDLLRVEAMVGGVSMEWAVWKNVKEGERPT